MSKIIEKFGKLSNSEWLEVLKRSVREPFIDGVEFPRFPHSSVQIGTNGSADEQAMVSAHALWLYASEYAIAYGFPLNEGGSVLDVGCGWGRITRTFMRDVSPANLVGVDIDPKALLTTEVLGVPAQLVQTYPDKPLPFPDHSFNVAICYSVFTHLPEKVATDLIRDITRVLKPGTLLVFTVEDGAFLDYLEQPRVETHGQRWAMLAKYQRDLPVLRAKYAKGHYIYLSTNDSGVLTSDVYGDAIIARAWMEKNWGEYLEIVRFEPTAAPINQAVVVARTRSAEPSSRKTRVR